MAILFFVMVVGSLLKLTITDPGSILNTALAASAGGVELALTLVGIYIVWMGVIQVAVDAGIINGLARLMSPVIRFLFGRQTEEVNALLATNISANLIGAGNAATPAAISAIEKMATPDMRKASTPMIMLFVLSATSLQILPTTVIGILETHGSTNASGIILPTILVSALSTVLGVILVKVFSSGKKKDDSRQALDKAVPSTGGG
jgi:spore maturation protein A